MARFKTRARAIDMLGRQQISGIPTAISELFKNAHDAYADRVEVDYYREDKLFVLRDDGLGMTKDEFETRWLTIGTESKLGAKAGLALPPRAVGKAKRPVLGEKGIGRLAIAAIGSQVLIVTRAKRGKVLDNVVVCYIHWGIFEQPGIDLDEIEIPIRTFPAGTLPDEEDIGEMVKEFAGNLKKLEHLTDEERARFEADFASTRLSVEEIDGFVPYMSLADEGHGTHFIIAPASPLLEADMADGTDDTASPFDQALLGFTNTMTVDAKPAIQLAFRDHLLNGLVDDKIAPEAFFTAEEFLSTDHHFQGEFDEYGQFVGTTSVYKKPTEPYLLAWDGANGKPTRCGPFKLKIAYLQGSHDQSVLPLEEWNNLKQKADRLGGVYIYKNGIRILPYGNTNYDWLNIEQRRTKKASRYFFSHRRMFGAIEIDQTINSELSEKAGREGFRENKAFREFKDILINFFLNLAADHFRESGSYSDDYFKIRTQIEEAYEENRKREQQNIQKRKAFAGELQQFEKALDDGEPQLKAESLLTNLREELQLASSISDKREAAQAVLRIEDEVRQQVHKLEDNYKIAKPRVAISASLERGYNAYLYQLEKLNSKTFKELRDLVETEISQVAQRARLALDRRVRIGKSLSDLAGQTLTTSQNERKQIFSSLETIDKWVRGKVSESISQISNEVRDVITEFNSIDFDELEELDVLRRRDELESKIIGIGAGKQQLLQAIRIQLERIQLDDKIAERIDQVSFLEQRVLTLEERDDEEIRLSQLGMAVEIISHEFESTIHDIRQGLRYLKGWADLNPGLDEIHEGLRLNFEHLDTYLSLFTPQQRRLYRYKSEFTGADISDYIENLFSNRFERHIVKLKVTPRFKKQKVTSYLSSFLPVFVNLTDNAIYWLKDKSKTISGKPSEEEEPRVIEFHAAGEDFLISNNGTELLPTYYESIFEHGVTHKPGGRGLGLAISRESLQKIDYTIAVDEIPRPGMSITFRISPKK